MQDPKPTETRPQQAGEAETTRFGMEDGDNIETPATGQGQLEDEEEEDRLGDFA